MKTLFSVTLLLAFAFSCVLSQHENHIHHMNMNMMDADMMGSMSDPDGGSMNMGTEEPMDHMEMGGMGMSMYFHADSQAYFLLKSLQSTDPWQVIVGCIVTFLICFAASFLTFFKRSYLLKNQDTNSFLDKGSVGNPLRVRIILTLIFMVQTTVGGLIMLLYMTYNVWVFITIVLGMAAGYFVADSKHDVSGAPAATHHH